MIRRPPRSTLFPSTTLSRSLPRQSLADISAAQGPAWAFGAPAPEPDDEDVPVTDELGEDRKSTRLNSSHSQISYAVFCLKKKKHLGRIVEQDAAQRIAGIVR